MIDRVDLLIAVVGIVVSILGSSTALWAALSRKADKADLDRLESRLEADLARLESRLEAAQSRVESKLDGLIMRFVPEHLPEQG